MSFQMYTQFFMCEKNLQFPFKNIITINVITIKSIKEKKKEQKKTIERVLLIWTMKIKNLDEHFSPGWNCIIGFHTIYLFLQGN